MKDGGGAGEGGLAVGVSWSAGWDIHADDKTPSREDTASASDLACLYVAMGIKLLSNLKQSFEIQT